MLNKIQLLACELVIVAYFLSIWRFKTWYIAAVGALTFTVALILLRSLTARGAVRAVAPVVVYFVYLFASSALSEFPAEAQWWAAADSIGVVVLFLFYTLTRNQSLSAVSDLFVRVMLTGVIVAVTLRMLQPEKTRLGGYTLVFLAAGVPYAWSELVRGRRRWRALAALLTSIGVLLVSRSRAPAAGGMLALFLAWLFIATAKVQRFKTAVVGGIVAVVLIGGIMAFAPTRVMLLTSFARLSGHDVVLGDLYIERGPGDSARQNLDALVARYFWEVQPFGLGYMTTGKLYARHFGTDARSLHNVFQTWAFEGGLICLVLVAAILWRQFFALRFAVRFAPSADAAAFARATAIATLTVLLIGLFHQVHQGPPLWVCLGVGLALRDRIGDDWHRP